MFPFGQDHSEIKMFVIPKPGISVHLHQAGGNKTFRLWKEKPLLKTVGKFTDFQYPSSRRCSSRPRYLRIILNSSWEGTVFLAVTSDKTRSSLSARLSFTIGIPFQARNSPFLFSLQEDFFLSSSSQGRIESKDAWLWTERWANSICVED